ncbi:methyltransferase domain-containing protein [Leptolyngbya sp. 15MV]|nr:methyltransferase domain-containing protein [Leptolyngbya sp. 15MV]
MKQASWIGEKLGCPASASSDSGGGNRIEQQTRSRLSDEQIARLNPYEFMSILGKRVIHPGGRRSTEELFQLAEFRPEHRVLEVGCGVGTTAVEIATRFGCHVTAVDIDPRMVARTEEAAREARVESRVRVREADIQALPFTDDSFDRVVIEAVTIFADRPQAAREVTRVCRPGGRVLEHEFIYAKPPTPEIRQLEDEVCGGARFDTVQGWGRLYEAAGLRDIKVREGPFAMMTLRGMLRDEGIANTLRMMLRILLRRAYRRKMMGFMSRMGRATPYLGYVVLVGTKEAPGGDCEPAAALRNAI